MKLSRIQKFCVVLAMIVTQTTGWGMTFSQVGILAAPVSEDLGITRLQVFLGATILYACAALTAAPAGKLADRFGGLALLVPGAFVLSGGLWALSLAQGLVSYLWPWALMGAVFHIGLVTAAYTALAQMLGRDAGRAISSVTIASGLCSTIFWPVSEWLLSMMSWHGVLQIYAAVMMCVCLPINVLLWRRFGHLRAGQGETAPDPAQAHVSEGQENNAQRLMILIACFGSVLGVGFGVAAIEVFTALGTPRLEAVFAGSLMGAAYVVSRVGVMVLERRITPATLAVLTYTVLPLSLTPLLYFAVNGQPLPGSMAAFVAFTFGLPAGLVGLLRSLFPLFLFGSNGYGTRLGVQARATEAASAVAPFGFTWALGISSVGLLSTLIVFGGGALYGAVRITRMIKAPVNSHKLEL